MINYSKKSVKLIIVLVLLILPFYNSLRLYAEGEKNITFGFNTDQTIDLSKFTSDPLEIDLYKVADITWNGTEEKYVFTNIEPYPVISSDFDVTTSYPQYVSSVIDNNLIFDAEQKLNSPDLSLKLSLNADNSIKVSDKSVYFAVIHNESLQKKDELVKNYSTLGKDDKNEYRFSPLLIFVYGDDVKVIIKYEKEGLPGELVIEKEIDSYSGNPVTFVFKVEEKTGENSYKEIDYVSLTFNKAGSKQTLVRNIPLGTELRITEVYAGSSYKIFGEDVKRTVITVPVEKKTDTNLDKVTFNNSFDNSKKGYGVSNSFTTTKDDTGKYIDYINNDLGGTN